MIIQANGRPRHWYMLTPTTTTNSSTSGIRARARVWWTCEWRESLTPTARACHYLHHYPTNQCSHDRHLHRHHLLCHHLCWWVNLLRRHCRAETSPSLPPPPPFLPPRRQEEESSHDHGTNSAPLLFLRVSATNTSPLAIVVRYLLITMISHQVPSVAIFAVCGGSRGRLGASHEQQPQSYPGQPWRQSAHVGSDNGFVVVIAVVRVGSGDDG